MHLRQACYLPLPACILQVQTMAVCRAWHQYLDPKRCPIEDLNLSGTKEVDLRIARWVTIKQPMLRSMGLISLATPQLLSVLLSVTPRTVSLTIACRTWALSAVTKLDRPAVGA